MRLYRQKMGWSVDGIEKEDHVPNSTLAKGTVIKTDIADVSEGFEQRTSVRDVHTGVVERIKVKSNKVSLQPTFM